MVAGLFPAENNEYHPLKGGNFSSVYGFRRSGRDFILRLTPPDSGISAQGMESILHWMQFLADNGVNVPRPVLSSQARLVEQVVDDEGVWLASVVEKAPGVLAELLPFEEWNPLRFARIGSAAGKMHTLSRQYIPTPDIQPRPHWHEASNNNSPSPLELDQAEAWVLDARNITLAQIAALPRDASSYGLIHADLQCANFFIETSTDTITLFDFDDCCYGWFLMDIALPLLDFLVVYPGGDGGGFAETFLQSFLRGYRAENSLEPGHLLHLPLFLRLLEIGLYIQVAPFAAESAPGSWVGKFMAGRKEGIQDQVPFVSLDMAKFA